MLVVTLAAPRGEPVPVQAYDSELFVLRVVKCNITYGNPLTIGNLCQYLFELI